MAVQHLSVRSVSGGGAVGMKHEAPAQAVDAHVVVELVALAWIRRRFFGGGFLSSLVSVTLGGVIITAVSAALGALR